MSQSRNRALIALLIAVALGAAAEVAALVVGSRSGYESPDAAVTATCHAVHILGDYSQHDGRYRIGWQPPGAAPGIGWTAIVEHHGGGYEVIDCKFQGVTHE
jgi:hypothetical protein